MGTLLKVVGGIWAALGVANVFMSPAIQNSGHETMGGLVVIFNFVFFVIPGLGLCGLGVAVEKKKAGAAMTAPKQPPATTTGTPLAVFCTTCGKPTQRGNRFCGSCGQVL